MKTKDGYILRYTAVGGKQLEVETSNRRVMTRNVMGNEVVATYTGSAGYSIRGGEKSDGATGFDIEFGARTFETDDPQMQVSPDFSELIGSQVYALLSPAGEITETSGFEALPEIGMGDGNVPLGEVQFRNEIRDMFPGLPERPVKFGDTWPVSRVFSEPLQGGELQVTLAYTCTLVEEAKMNGHNCVKIDASFTGEITGHGGSGGIDFELAMEGSGSQVIYFAHDAGMLVSMEEYSEFAGEATNDDMGLVITLAQGRDASVSVAF
jgi:hypothetical protein